MSEYNQQRIIKSSGSNKSEEYLIKIANKTFLSLWSFPNVYTDEGKSKNGVGIELCDLLVVFDNNILIFSDKDIQFKTEGDLKTNWKRWLKKSVIKSASQVYGAEKFMKDHPGRLFLDSQCKQNFPIKIDDFSKIKFHRILVTKNSSKIARKQWGGRGSLIIAPDIDVKMMQEKPFHIGTIDSKKGFLHILDDATFDLVLTELSTISDFVDYLTKKEEYLTSGKLGIAAGEEELLAAYLLNSGEFPNYPDTDKMLIDEGHYDKLTLLPQYIQGKIKDRDSSIIDSFIEHFAQHVFDRTLETDNVNSYEDEIIGLKTLASENRLSRRVLGKFFLQKIQSSFDLKNPSSIIIKSPTRADLTYLLLVVPVPDIAESYLDYRIARRNLLIMYCQAAKLKVKSSNEIVGFAIDTPNNEKGTEDIVHLDCKNWGTQEYAEAENALKDLKRAGLMKQFSKKRERAAQYPITSSKLGKLKKIKLR